MFLLGLLFLATEYSFSLIRRVEGGGRKGAEFMIRVSWHVGNAKQPHVETSAADWWVVQSTLFAQSFCRNVFNNLKFYSSILCLSGMEGDPDLQFLLQGGILLKVRSSSWKKSRYFRLLEDCKTMWGESQKTFRTNQTCEYHTHTSSPWVWKPPAKLLHLLQWTHTHITFRLLSLVSSYKLLAVKYNMGVLWSAMID